MGYGKRDLMRIKLGICLDCQERAAGKRRRCLTCRLKRLPKQTPTQRDRARVERGTMSYLEAKRREQCRNRKTYLLENSNV